MPAAGAGATATVRSRSPSPAAAAPAASTALLCARSAERFSRMVRARRSASARACVPRGTAVRRRSTSSNSGAAESKSPVRTRACRYASLARSSDRSATPLRCASPRPASANASAAITTTASEAANSLLCARAHFAACWVQGVSSSSSSPAGPAVSTPDAALPRRTSASGPLTPKRTCSPPFIRARIANVSFTKRPYCDPASNTTTSPFSSTNFACCGEADLSSPESAMVQPASRPTVTGCFSESSTSLACPASPPSRNFSANRNWPPDRRSEGSPDHAAVDDHPRSTEQVAPASAASATTRAP